MDTSTVRLRAAYQTDIGKNPSRVKNEDYQGSFEGEFGHLYLVCDGMGGQQGGDIAARICVESIRNFIETHYMPGEEQDVISRSVDFAQEKILEAVSNDPDLADMGTTLVLLLIQGANYWYAHTGDSRLYLSRGGSLNQLTKDHSEVQGLVDSGIISREQAVSHPQRNVITKAIGSSNYAPEISGPHALKQDDVFLLCTDGLTDYVKDRELLQQMSEEPMVACYNLVEMANTRGGADNVTVVVVQVQQCTPFSLGSEPVRTPRKRKFPPIGIWLVVLAFLAAVVWYAQSLNKNPRQPREKVKTEKVAKSKDKKKSKKQKEDVAAANKPRADIEETTDQKLTASAASDAYQQMLDKATTGGTKLRLKFFTNSQDKQMVYILPGQAIYINFSELQSRDSYNMSKDQIEALIVLAAASAKGKAPLGGDDWEEKLFAPGTASIDAKTYEAARALYKLYDDVNADALFNSNSRFGKYQQLIKAGTYNFAIDLPK